MFVLVLRWYCAVIGIGTLPVVCSYYNAFVRHCPKASLVGGPLYWEEGTVGAALSAEDIKIVELHTAFYVVWLLGELWFLALLAQTRREYILSRPWCTRPDDVQCRVRRRGGA